MQEKFGKDGLVAVTVNMDFAADPGVSKEKYTARALAILKEKKVDAINLYLDVDNDTLEKIREKKLRIIAFPAAYVFDRQGRWSAFRAVEGAPDADDKEIERFVEKLVKEK